MNKEKSVKDWQERIESKFAHDGIVGGRFLLPIIDRETINGQIFSKKYNGFRIITDSFIDFFAQTIIEQANFNAKNGWPKDPYYATSITMYSTAFRAIRAAEILSTSSYPMQGYAVLRSVKDQIWILCAAANEIATIEELFGFYETKTPSLNDDMNSIVENRMKIEKEIKKYIIGKNSELSEDSQKWLEKWERMFNWEAHRGIYTLLDVSKTLTDPEFGAISLVSGNSGDLDAMYLNRSIETNWMLHRLLPFARREESSSEEWKEKWDLLNESFQIIMESLIQMDKPIASAFTELIEKKFRFDPSFFFKHKKK